MLIEEEVEAVTTSIEVVDEVFRITTVVAEVISTILKIPNLGKMPNLGTQTPTFA